MRWPSLILLLILLPSAAPLWAAAPVPPAVEVTDALKVQLKTLPVGQSMVLTETVGCQQCLRRYEKVSATEMQGKEYTGQCTALPCANTPPTLKVE